MAHGDSCVPAAKGHMEKYLCPTRWGTEGQWHCRRSWNGLEVGSHGCGEVKACPGRPGGTGEGTALDCL